MAQRLVVRSWLAPLMASRRRLLPCQSTQRTVASSRKSGASCVQDAMSKFLNDLSGVTVPGGSESVADVYLGGVTFEVAVSDE